MALRVAAEAGLERRREQVMVPRVDELDEAQEAQARAVGAERQPELAMERAAQLTRMSAHQAGSFTSAQVGLLQQRAQHAAAEIVRALQLAPDVVGVDPQPGHVLLGDRGL